MFFVCVMGTVAHQKKLEEIYNLGKYLLRINNVKS